MSAQATARLRNILTEQVQWSAGTKLLFLGDEEYATVPTRWNLNFTPGFLAIVRVAKRFDVHLAVKTAKSNGIPFMAIGTGHGYGTTMSRLQGGIAIDLSLLKDIEVDKAAERVSVGPGVTNEELVKHVSDAGFEIPSGSCSTVSVIGSTLGGGVGRWSGVYGLLIDSLLRVIMVTGNGSLVEASESVNPGLFWGIRGAGANFGIVVAAEFKLHKPINNGNVLSADFLLPIQMKDQYLDVVQSMSEQDWPAELTLFWAIGFDPKSGSPLIVGNYAWFGAEDEGRKVLDPLLALNAPVSNMSVLSYGEITKLAGFGGDATACRKGFFRTIYSANLRTFSRAAYDTAVDEMVRFFDENPDGRSSIVMFEMFGNEATRNVPGDATAYPWRDTTTYAMFQFSWTQSGSSVEAVADALGTKLRKQFAEASGYSDLAVYVSYAHGDETLEQTYGKEKLPRLAALKKQHDPDNVFRYHFPLPLEYP